MLTLVLGPVRAGKSARAAALAAATGKRVIVAATAAHSLAITRAHAIVVAEETGWGVVPPTPQGRIFRDALGRLTQTLAQRADRVELVVAGYAIDLRAIGKPVGET